VPEPLGRRLIAGIRPGLGAMLTAKPIFEYSAVQHRSAMNGNGDVLVLTAEYGEHRDVSTECPAAWTGAIRWASSDGSTRSWTARVAPADVIATPRGFILVQGCTPKGVPSPASPWYVDGSGRIGSLRPISGPPPVGVAATNPRPGWDCQENETYLAEVDSDRVWLLEPVPMGPAVSCDATVLAQDADGVQWLQTFDHSSHVPTLWWSGPGEREWHRRDFATRPYQGQLLYSGGTIGILGTGAHGRSVLDVSTDRGSTWTTRPFNVARDFGARHTAGSWDIAFATLSGGTLLVSVNTSSAGTTPYLMRSTDPGWTTFERVDAPSGSLARGYPHLGAMSGQAVGSCDDDFVCHVSLDAGDTWRTFRVPVL